MINYNGPIMALVLAFKIVQVQAAIMAFDDLWPLLLPSAKTRAILQVTINLLMDF